MTFQLNELGKDMKTFITEATSKINKVVANNINIIACLVNEDYTKQLATDITDILQNKVDYLMIPSTSHDNDISIQLDSYLVPITAKLTTIDTEQSASKLAEIAISTKPLVNKPPVPAPPLPMPTATSNLTSHIPASYANALQQEVPNSRTPIPFAITLFDPTHADLIAKMPLSTGKSLSSQIKILTTVA